MRFFKKSKPMKWAVLIAAPAHEAGAHWGDTWFANDLVAALHPLLYQIIDAKVFRPKVLGYNKNPQLHLSISSKLRD